MFRVNNSFLLRYILCLLYVSCIIDKCVSVTVVLLIVCVFFLIEDTMALRGVRSFLCHYGGRWAVKDIKYIGGKTFWLDDIDGDEFCYMDLVKDLEVKFGIKGGKIQWLWDGCISNIESDANLIDMWDHIKPLNKYFHLYLIESNAPKDKLVACTSTNKVVNHPKPKPTTLEPRKSPRFKTPTKKTNLPKKPVVTPSRRSFRLLSKHRFNFSTNA